MEINKALIESLENYTQQCELKGPPDSDCGHNLNYLAAKYALKKIAKCQPDFAYIGLGDHLPFGVYLLVIATFQPWQLQQIDWPKSLANHDRNPDTEVVILRESVNDECMRLFKNAQGLALNRLSKITDASEFLSTDLPQDFELGLQLAYASIIAMGGANLPCRGEVDFIFKKCSIVADGYAKAAELRSRVLAGSKKQDWVGELLRKFFYTAQTRGINLTFMSLVNFLKAQDEAVFRSKKTGYPAISLEFIDQKPLFKVSRDRKTSIPLKRRAMSDRVARFKQEISK